MRTINLQNKTHSACGEYCKFYIIGKLGLKVYRDYNTAHSAYLNQKLAHKFGVAPKTFGFYKVIRDGYVYYGYRTQIVDCLSYDVINGSEYQDILAEKLSNIFDQLYIDPYDFHRKNTGFIGGRMVGIDFDPVMTGEFYKEFRNVYGRIRKKTLVA